MADRQQDDACSKEKLARLADLVRDKTGARDLVRLVALVGRCGFDAGEYARANELPDLAADPDAAALHFLAHGHVYSEARPLPFGSLPERLEAIPAEVVPNRDYAVQLFRCIFFNQLRHPNTPERLWRGLDARFHRVIRDMGGIPYYVLGDSHVRHYTRAAWRGRRWFAPLPLLIAALAAINLANGSPRRAKILEWAQKTADRHAGFDVPIFFKIGGVDTEYRWMWMRLNENRPSFSPNEFEQFVRKSIAAYGDFLGVLSEIIDPALFRICSVFPAVITDASWKDDFLRLLTLGPEETDAYRAKLKHTEVPDLVARTAMRALFNAHLKTLRWRMNLRVIDDFSPLLNTYGVLDSHFRPRVGESHLDFPATEGPIVRLIRAALPGGVDDFVARASAGADFVFLPGFEETGTYPAVLARCELTMPANEDRTVLSLAGAAPDAQAGGATEGYSIRLPDTFEAAASGKNVRIVVVARTENENPAPARFAVAYSTNEVGNSGWRWFSADPDWRRYEMTWAVPAMRDGNGDFVGLLPDAPGKPGIDIAAVALTIGDPR